MQMAVVRKALASFLEVDLTPSPSARHTEALRTVKKMLDTAGTEVFVNAGFALASYLLFTYSPLRLLSLRRLGILIYTEGMD